MVNSVYTFHVVTVYSYGHNIRGSTFTKATIEEHEALTKLNIQCGRFGIPAGWQCNDGYTYIWDQICL